MQDERQQRCPRCGAVVPAGAAACPHGHANAQPFTDDASALASGGLPSPETGSVPSVAPSSTAPAPANTIFECRHCDRLVETQMFQDRRIDPRFCPWCGGRLASIIGRDIDGYRLESVIARGGFGIIYLASNITEPKMKAVVKLLRPEMFYYRPELVRVFVEEARLTEEIGQTCWNVVRVSNVREKPWPYFFMEYLRGRTLDTVIREAPRGGLPLADCKGYLRGMARALVATHKHGRVHRDLKPLNIMIIESREISPEERVKLLDFGLAMKIAGAQAGMRRTGLSGSALSSTDQGESPVRSAGTPEYMPPEAFAGLNEFSGDIYSFGVTAYEILTRKRPWEDPADDVDRFFYWRDCHRTKPPRPVRQLRPEVPGWLAKVVALCLVKSPKHRIPSAEKLAERLREPLPRWVWPAASVALILVACLLAFAIQPAAYLPIEWRDEDGRAIVAGNSCRLLVTSADDLPARRLFLSVRADAGGSRRKVLWEQIPGATIEGLTGPEGDGLYRLTLPKDAALLGKRLPITGKGVGFNARGELSIEQDTEPPVVGPMLLVEEGGSGKPAEVGEGPVTIQAGGARLAVRIQEPEERLRPPVFRVYREARPVSSIPGEKEKIGTEECYAFALKRLKSDLTSGVSYTGRLEVEDRAGNKGRDAGGKPCSELAVRFSIKEDIKSIFGEKPAFIAGGRAFVELQVKDPIGRIAVAADGAGDADFELYKNPGDKSVFSLFAKLAPLAGRDPRSLTVGGRFFIGVAVKRGGPPSFTVTIADTARPPNVSRPVTVACPIPDPPEISDLDSISLRFPRDPLPDRHRMRPDKEEIEVSPISADDLQEVRVTLREGVNSGEQPAIWRGECRLNGGPSRPATVDVDSVAFTNLSLKLAEKDNVLDISLFDGLEKALPVKLRFARDTEKPKIDVRAISDGKENPTFHTVSGKDIRLEVEANEPLSKVAATCRNAHREAKPGEVPSLYVADGLAGLDLQEDSNPIHIVALDLAGNSAEVDLDVVIDSGPPSVKLNATQMGSQYQLPGSELTVTVSDPNGIDYEDAAFTFECDEPSRKKGEIRVPKPAEPGTTDEVTISLTQIPPRATGTLTAHIPDRYGLVEAYAFRFRRTPGNLEETIAWKDLDWVKVSGDKADFYISRTEIPNRLFAGTGFLEDGVYAGEDLKKRIGRDGPKYWEPGKALPVYTKAGKVLPAEVAGSFPVVGVTPAEAEAFAAARFGPGVRLPTYEEWKAAAWSEFAGGRYPWGDDGEAAGKPYSNCFRSAGDAAFRDKCAEMIVCRRVSARPVPHTVVPVDLDPFEDLPESARDKLNGYRGKILHLIGNAGELVAYQGGWAVMGGHYDFNYEKIDIHKPLRFEEPQAQFGFRLVIEPDSEAWDRLMKASVPGGDRAKAAPAKAEAKRGEKAKAETRKAEPGKAEKKKREPGKAEARKPGDGS